MGAIKNALVSFQDSYETTEIPSDADLLEYALAMGQVNIEGDGDE